MTANRCGRSVGLAAAAALLALACGSNDDGPTGNTDSTAPAYALSITPGALTVAAGASNTANVTIDRTNFMGGVTLELVSPPAGITGVFTPTSSTTNAAQLALTVGASVAPGNYPLTVKGGATGIAERTAPLALTVVAAPTAGRTAEYVYCDTAQAPVFFVYQDGTGAWRAVARSGSGTVSRFGFDFASSRGGVLAVFRSTVDAEAPARAERSAVTTRFSPGITFRNHYRGDRGQLTNRRSVAVDVYVTEVLYASATELAQDGAGTCAQTLPTKSVTATIAGVSPGQYGIASLGSSTEVFDGAASRNPLTLSGVQGGYVDFVGTRIVRPGLVPDRAVVFRNLNIPDGGSLPSTIDFNASTAVVPVSANATITGSSGALLEIFTTVITATSDMQFWFDLAPSTATLRPWAGLGASQMTTRDFHSLIVFASSPSKAGDFRASLKYVAAVSDQTLALAPVVEVPTATRVAGGGYPRFRFQGTLPTEYNKGVGIEVSGEDPGNVFSALVSSAYLAAAGNALGYDLTMPDAAGLPGFPSAARLDRGSNTVTVDAFGFTGAAAFDVRPAVGGEFRASVRTSTITVP